jgi:hypothetical protein
MRSMLRYRTVNSGERYCSHRTREASRSGGIIVVVRISSMALRIAVLVELVLGVALWIGSPLAPVLLHMALGLLIVALVWFLGLAQATVKDGSLSLTFATFGVGLTLAIIGLVQKAVPSQTALQIVHVLLALATIAVGEMATARYWRGKKAIAAAAS